ncbi:MAG: alanine racemase [Myxococcota bacterium]|nr:alanine racemase [Myxococcota bacterium]
MSFRPTRATIDLTALRGNLAHIRSSQPEAALCGVVKADAYGHGSVPLAKVLEEEGIDWLAVSLVEEGIELRRAGVLSRILVLSAPLKGAVEALLKYRLTPTVFSIDQLDALIHESDGQPLNYHLKVDSGMHRLGLDRSEVNPFLDRALKSPHLNLDGLMTHLQSADLGDDATSQAQLDHFKQTIMQVRVRGIRPTWIHTHNSAGCLSIEKGSTNLLRPGLILYGLSPMDAIRPPELRPLMRWTTEPLQLKDIPTGARVSYGGHFTAQRPTRLMILPVGYRDGYRKGFEGQAHVLVRGQRAPVVGSICMDLCMVDITDIPHVALGDEVVLMGPQGDEELTAYELASWAGTIPYEIPCAISDRVSRSYVETFA